MQVWLPRQGVQDSREYLRKKTVVSHASRPPSVITYRAKVAAALWPNRFKVQAQVSIIEYDQVVCLRGMNLVWRLRSPLKVTALNVALGEITKNALWELLDTSDLISYLRK
jgi:hypothetical protein